MSAAKPAVPSGFQTFKTLVWAEAIVFVRTWRALIWTIALPVLIVALGLGRSAAGGGTAVFAVSAMALVLGTFALGLMGYSTVLASYRDRGIFQLLRCTPAPASQLLAARLAVQLLAVLAEGVVVLLAGFIFYGVIPAWGSIGLGLLVLLATGLVALSLGQLVAALTREAATTTAVARGLIIILFAMAAMGGMSRNLPDGLVTLANWSPLKLAQELLTAALAHGRTNGYQLAALLLWTVVMGFIGLRRFRWEAA